jgi:hypothetical protein
MKALDHVLLWVARLFALVILVWSLFIAYGVICTYCRELTMFARHHIAWHLSGEVNIGTFAFPFLLIVVTLWNMGLWWLRKDAGRLYLGLSGVLMFLAFAWRIMNALVWHPNMLDWQECLSDGLYLVGFFAMAWTALRAPGQPRIKLTPTMPHCQASSKTQKDSHPPFFMRFFRNPAPSVKNSVIPKSC